MRKELQKKAEEYIRGGSKRKRLRVFVSVLSLVVTLSTLYMLSTPAMTLEKAACLEAEEPTGTGDLISADATLNPQEEENAPSGESASGDGNAAGDNESSSESGSESEQTVGDESQQHGSESDDMQSEEASDDVENSDGTENPAESDIDENAPSDDVPADDNGSQEDSGAKDEEKASESEDTDSEETEAKYERSVYDYAEDGLVVTAVLSDPAAVPDDAELYVTRITEESDPERYAQLAELLQAGTGSGDALEFSAYDIAFLCGGAEIEPTVGTVSVTIEDTTASEATAEAAEDNIKVYHVLNEAGDAPELQEVPAEAGAEEGGTTFTADSFSAYLLVQTATAVQPTKWIDSEEATFIHTQYYNSNSPLGIAGSFHIVAFDTANLIVHTNGNVLAATLYAHANFGTDNLANELTYVQDYAEVHPTSASNQSHVLAIGSKNKLTLVDNGNAFGVNGTKLDKPKYVWMDANSNKLPFIDLTAVKSEVSGISATMAALSNANIDDTKLNASAGSCDESYLTLTNPDGIGVCNINASTLSSYSDKYFGVKGFVSGHDGTVIINVDGTGASTINLPNCEIFVDNNKLSFSPQTSFQNSRVVWNFTNFTGTINTERMYASIIAPDATINVDQNLNGTVIGKCVNIKAESHRDDFVGKLPASVTVSKVWCDSDGNQITGCSLSGMSVTVQLYRSEDGGTKTAVGGTVELSCDNNWTYVWDNLTQGYTYSVEEVTVTKNGTDISAYYDATYSSNGLCSGVIYVYNQFQYTLPSTGGIGTLPYTIAGLLLIGAAFYINKKLKRYRKRVGAQDSA